MQEDKTTIEKNSVVKGLNGDVAYRIGKCYLEGNILPINKKKARDFLAYGMVVGSVDCALAYVLFCMGLDFKEKATVVVYRATVFGSGIIRYFGIRYSSVSRCNVSYATVLCTVFIKG